MGEESDRVKATFGSGIGRCEIDNMFEGPNQYVDICS
jgi:hypothetical protein